MKATLEILKFNVNDVVTASNDEIATCEIVGQQVQECDFE